MSWWLLGLTTVPIHLLLNSVVFASLQANDYGVLVVDNTFRTDDTWNQTCALFNEGTYSATPASNFICSFRDQILDGSVHYTTLDIQQCIQQYANNLQSTSSSLILFTEIGTSKWANLPNSTDLPDGLGLNYVATLGKGSIDKAPWFRPRYWSKSNQVQGDLLLAYDSPLLDISSLYAVWNSLSYRYWAITELIDYNFNNSAAQLATQWLVTINSLSELSAYLYPGNQQRGCVITHTQYLATHVRNLLHYLMPLTGGSRLPTSR